MQNKSELIDQKYVKRLRSIDKMDEFKNEIVS